MPCIKCLLAKILMLLSLHFKSTMGYRLFSIVTFARFLSLKALIVIRTFNKKKALVSRHCKNFEGSLTALTVTWRGGRSAGSWC